MNLFDFLEKHSSAISVIFLVFGGLWGIYKFRIYIRDRRFRTYHDLIGQLVDEQKQPDRQIKLDRQIAVIFELRNFPEYFGVTKRILEGLKKGWKDKPEAVRVIEEIDLTLEYITIGVVKRFFIRHSG